MNKIAMFHDMISYSILTTWNNRIEAAVLKDNKVIVMEQCLGQDCAKRAIAAWRKVYGPGKCRIHTSTIY